MNATKEYNIIQLMHQTMLVCLTKTLPPTWKPLPWLASTDGQQIVTAEGQASKAADARMVSCSSAIKLKDWIPIDDIVNSEFISAEGSITDNVYYVFLFFTGPRSLEGIDHAKSALKRSACTSSKALPGYLYTPTQKLSLFWEGFLHFLVFLGGAIFIYT